MRANSFPRSHAKVKLVVLLRRSCISVPERGRSSQPELCAPGVWIATEAQRDGKAAPDDIGHQLAFNDGRFVITSNDQPVYSGTVTVDTTSNPARIDFVHAEGQAKGMTWEGIYQLNDNSLVICDDAFDPTKRRPTSFIYFRRFRARHDYLQAAIRPLTLGPLHTLLVAALRRQGPDLAIRMGRQMARHSRPNPEDREAASPAEGSAPAHQVEAGTERQAGLGWTHRLLCLRQGNHGRWLSSVRLSAAQQDAGPTEPHCISDVAPRSSQSDLVCSDQMLLFTEAGTCFRLSQGKAVLTGDYHSEDHGQRLRPS